MNQALSLRTNTLVVNKKSPSFGRAFTFSMNLLFTHHHSHGFQFSVLQ